jgi:hypothetical protein
MDGKGNRATEALYVPDVPDSPLSPTCKKMQALYFGPRPWQLGQFLSGSFSAFRFAVEAPVAISLFEDTDYPRRVRALHIRSVA